MKRNSKIIKEERIKELKHEPMTLINVYAPPESNKYLFKSLFGVIAVETEGNLIAVWIHGVSQEPKCS